MGWPVRGADSRDAGILVRFTETTLPGAYVIDLDRYEDHRGFFARTWCRREFGEHGLEQEFVQASISHSYRRGTVRGMHYQVAPHEEVKLVRCTRGAILDVIIDLRPNETTYTRHFAVELSVENGRALYVPEGFAHGFQTLQDDTEVCYHMSEFHSPDAARGVRWDDPLFEIDWPIADPVIKERDASYPDYEPVGGAQGRSDGEAGE